MYRMSAWSVKSGGFYELETKMWAFVGEDEEVERTQEILKMYLLLVQLDELILLETVKQMTV